MLNFAIWVKTGRAVQIYSFSRWWMLHAHLLVVQIEVTCEKIVCDFTASCASFLT